MILKAALGEAAGGAAESAADLAVPEEPAFGHYSTNVAMRVAKQQGKNPLEFANELAAGILAKAPAGFFEKVEVAAPGFVNFWLSKKTIREEFSKVTVDKKFGTNESLKGRLVMVEFTDPNPFKLFHIGHLMSNSIGESFARLHEAAGAKVLRANYQGDVGLQVAKTIWGMEHGEAKRPDDASALAKKMEYLGAAYVVGNAAYDTDAKTKEAIVAINEKVYARSDAAINELYDKGRTWSLDYFETVYKRLGTKFDHYFFESEVGKEGAEFVWARKDIFKVSDGAVVFPGEQYGLHTRVFINSKGLPTYEAKELGLNKKKFELYPLDLSVIVTGNEITDYFRVLLKAMELVLPDVAAKTKHVPHGMLRLPSGKMSSRTGDVITAESLLDQIKAKLVEKVSEKSDLNEKEREAATEVIAIGAIKYSILKQNPGQDIIFDFEKSLSFDGDSGPYLQYTYARLKSILRKAGDEKKLFASDAKFESLDADVELALVRKIFEFSNAVLYAEKLLAPSGLATYLHKLAVAANRFYETTPILKDEDEARRSERLVLVEVAAQTLKSGLELLGIKTLEKI